MINSIDHRLTTFFSPSVTLKEVSPGKFRTTTITDGDIVRSLIGKATVSADEIDGLLTKLGLLGYSLTTLNLDVIA